MYLKQLDATSGNEEKKRSVYKRKDKQDIMKCTSQFGLQKPLGNLNTGLLTYMKAPSDLGLKSITLKFGQTRGKPLLLHAELD